VKVDHIGIAVRDLTATVGTYRTALGLEASAPETVESQKVRVAFVAVGESHLEFLEATDPSAPVARFLERRGEGMHHIAFQVESVDRTLAGLQEQGLAVIDRVGRTGARGRRVGFAHPSAFHGVLVEFVEAPP
jgi:methylmalonyl-CoA/ethylmalonyl-CoA epimerase